MSWFFILLLLSSSFSSILVNMLKIPVRYPFENVHCGQNEFNLDHTLSLGIIGNWIGQLTVNFTLIMYPHRSNHYLTMFGGIGNQLDKLYPKIQQLKTFNMMTNVSLPNLPTTVSFSIQKDVKTKLLNIYGYIHKNGRLNYFIQRFNQGINPKEYLNIKTHLSFIKIISFWTGMADSNVINNQTNLFNLHLASTTNHDAYFLFPNQDLNIPHRFICFTGNSLQVSINWLTDCTGDKYWLSKIRFGFFFNKKIYLVSVLEKKVWSISEEFIVNQDGIFLLKEENYSDLFNCTPPIQPDDDRYNIFIILLVLFFIIAVNIIILNVYLMLRWYYGNQKRKKHSKLDRNSSSFSEKSLPISSKLTSQTISK